MTEKQNKIAKLLWDFHSLREEHIIRVCECTKHDIDVLTVNKVLVRDKETKLVRHRGKEINNRNIVAFDVVMEYLDRNPEIKKGKFPVNVTLQTKYTSYDIIVIKEDEADKLFEEIDDKSTADKIIIIIETNHYIRRKIKTKRPCYICISPPLDIIDRLN